MNKSFLLLAFVLFAAYANAQCGTNASSVSGNCLCNQGYYGQNAASGSTCQQCPTGTTTGAPSSSGNTSGTVDVSICNQCSANYYMTVAAVTGASPVAAQCSQCTNGSGNTGATAAGDVSQCNTCQANYYQTANAVTGASPAAATCQQCPNNGTSPAGSTQSSACTSGTTSSKILLASLTILIASLLA